MTFINKGYYYNVYDLGNLRVRKIEKGFLKKISDAYFFEGRKILNWLIACYNIFRGRKHIHEVYTYMKNNVRLDILGNPVFLSGIDYEQDKVELIGTYFELASDVEIRMIMDRYVDNIFESWKQGFSDRVYNFLINNGIDKNGDVVLIDFNEVTLSKGEILRNIDSKRWLKASSYTRLDPLHKDYYLQKMEHSITRENLELYWKGQR